MKAKYVKYGIPFIAGVLFLLSSSVTAQTSQNGELIIHKDSLIDILKQLRLESDLSKVPSTTNSSSSNSNATKTPNRSSATRTTTTGFRVQIYLGSSRSQAYAEQARFKRMYRDIEAYVTYAEPNYRVKVGDFKSRAEAQKLMQGLRSQFSNVFIFTETIYVYQ